MTKRIYVDIETLPPDATALTGDDHLLRDPEGEEFKRLALNGDYGRVLCVGVIVEEDGQIIRKGVLGRERQSMAFHLDEARTLRAFWKLLRDFRTSRDLIVGHNIFDFDLLYLYKRSVIHRVRPTVNFSFARYRSAPIFDTMREWEHWGRNYISLDKLAKILGLESSKQNGIDGSKVYEKFCEGCHEAIASYCLADVELTRGIFKRLSFEESDADEQQQQ
jgi:DNA polymerase elongation subunit (family B)